MRKILIIIAILVVVGGAWLVFGSIKGGIKESKQIKSPVHTVKRSDMLVSITEGGNLKATREVRVSAEVGGQIVSLVDEGSWVKKGDVLVELDPTSFEERVSREEIEYRNAVSAHEQAKENYEIRKSQNASDIKEAELKYRFAQLDLKKYIEGEWPLEIKKQKAQITIAEDELVRARNRLDWTKKLQEKGYATLSELESDQLNVRRKQLEVDQQKDKLKLMETYDYPQQVEKLKSDVDKRKQELERVKRRAKAELSRVAADLSAKEINMKTKEGQLDDAKEQLNHTKILAPQEGLVIYHKGRRWNRKEIAVGAKVHNRQRLIELPDTSELMVEIKVHESRISQLAVGQTAYITLDAMPDKRFKGEVRAVAPMPDPTSWWNPTLKVYTTEIVIKDPLPAEVKPGLSARAEIIADKLDDVITVPIQAVTTHQKKQVCYIKDKGEYTVVPVKVGEYNDTNVHIVKGLEEGQQILLNPPDSDEAEALGISIVDRDEVKDSDVKPKPAPKKPEQEESRKQQMSEEMKKRMRKMTPEQRKKMAERIRKGAEKVQ